MKILWNNDWFFSRIGENNEKQITLPHDAMILENRSLDSLGGKNTGWYEGYDYLYTKKFFAPSEFEGKKLIIEFEGVYHNAEVYLNEEKIAFRPYGYTNFYVDISKKLKINEENEVKVVARNADQPNSRWYSGSGIYRPVQLYVLPEEHIVLNGIKISTLNYQTRTIEVAVETSTLGMIDIEILDGETTLDKANLQTDGKVVWTQDLPDAKLWNTETPYLYTCKVKFGEHVEEVVFGIRQIECTRENSFCINGERVILRGSCVHHDNGILGARAYDFAEERKVRIMKEAGYNAIRSAHNPCSKAMLDACDRLGMLVVDEYVDCWYIHKTKNDYALYCMDWWRQDLKDMVDKDFNHPSVIMYSTGNEVSETAEERGIKFTGQMTEYLHQLDDTRPVTCGVNIFFNYLSSLGFGVYTDKKAEKAVSKGKQEAVGSEFFNNLAGILGDRTMKLGASLHGCDVKTRDAFANMDVAGYNYGIYRYKKDLKKYPERIIVGSETFCNDAYRFYEFAKQNTGLIGDFVWAGMDYLGEVGVGAWEYRDYAPDFTHQVGWVSAGSGRVDLIGNELGEAKYTKVAFEIDKIHIAVVPVNNAFKPHSPSAWKMTNAMDSWSWDDCDGQMTKVEVYARAYRVALYVNSKKVGEKKLRNDCKAIFKTKYYRGQVVAIAYDEQGKEIARTLLESAGEETKLTVLPEDEKLGMDDLCYIRLKYTDHTGTKKPLARGDIKVSIKGGELLALGNACPYNARGYNMDVTDTYYGEALAVVKPKGVGKIEIFAESQYGNAQSSVMVISK
ncbi:glycoside hydrolase family 2 TIM barrel-domain containing protein [Litchfieldia salsa]|uniref:Beta-galactosidase n=1 Tax=Litchfieldia salsa TaxID=930152 RepID=A0A1H0VP21_9BACI|nr:glycoside hydrolase family 2 TIM barrel-domain containing protein [Litchfieldia salsa]SDP79826.1 beta-galactosidase [Litchfieldia salsa]